MRTYLCLCVAILCFCIVALMPSGCNQPLHQQQARMAPEPGETLPEWAYDAPHYFRPPPEAVPQPLSVDASGEPAHYHVKNRVILLERPGTGVPLDHAPRIGVWWTNTDGAYWMRAGYFGLGQTHFAFVAGDDGAYGIRFTGPGIDAAPCVPSKPQRVYHLDTQLPLVHVWAEPMQCAYAPGQQVTFTWCIDDAALAADSVRIGLCWLQPENVYAAAEPGRPRGPCGQQGSAGQGDFESLPGSYGPQGVFTFRIPPSAAGMGFQFQVRADDLAGNRGFGYAEPVFVCDGCEPQQAAEASPSAPQLDQPQPEAMTPPRGE